MSSVHTSRFIFFLLPLSLLARRLACMDHRLALPLNFRDGSSNGHQRNWTEGEEMQPGDLVSWTLPSRSPRLTATTDLKSTLVQATLPLRTITSALPVTLH